VKRSFPLFCVLMAACASLPETPNDFPPPPSTVIVEFPTPGFATPTLELRLRPITEDKMEDARAFFLILYTRVLSGDSYGIAESVKYPIAVELNPMSMIAGPEEFVAHYDQIFSDRIVNALTDTDEEDLIQLPEGIRIGHGEIWFNLFCTDPTCVDSQFLITQINN
jgi:hypothetical protein